MLYRIPLAGKRKPLLNQDSQSETKLLVANGIDSRSWPATLNTVKQHYKILKYGEIAQLVEQVKNENILCIFSSPNDEIVNTKVTSKFHAKDRVVSSSLTLPTIMPR